MAGLIPVNDIESARALIDAFTGPAEEFELPVAETLQDALGLNMALITDRNLKKGWEPDGFKQCRGYRLYRYKSST